MLRAFRQAALCGTAFSTLSEIFASPGWGTCSPYKGVGPSRERSRFFFCVFFDLLQVDSEKCMRVRMSVCLYVRMPFLGPKFGSVLESIWRSFCGPKLGSFGVPNWVGSGVLLSPKTHMPDQKVLIWAKMVCGNMTVNTFWMFGALLICMQFGSQFRGRFGGHFGVPNWVGLGVDLVVILGVI